MHHNNFRGKMMKYFIKLLRHILFFVLNYARIDFY